ncbi:MAG: response regulator [Spirochaetota bacterium]
MSDTAILIIDDDPLLLHSLEDNLERHGYTVMTAENGNTALALLKKYSFDIVITDLVMAHSDGIHILKYVKEINPVIGVLILTAYANLGSAIEALRYEADDYLQKPCEMKELLLRLSKVLEKQKLLLRRLELETQVKQQNAKLTDTVLALQREIARHKKTETLLQKIREELEERVHMRTEEFIRINKELKKKTQKLKETNIALQVLLKKREEEKYELEERVLININSLVLPYLEKLHRSTLDPEQKTYLSILESNLNNVISPFLKMTSLHMYLTPTELQISNLIIEGKTTKEIADILNVSARTVESHRDNIRKKLDIKNEKINLRSYLLSIQ